MTFFFRAFLLAVGLMVATMTPAFAEDHRGGANRDCGAYCPTEDNDRQGNGHAPQDGTKGRADSKNPPGQASDGGDPNRGYECDRQAGVGDGNPAHTGCASRPSPAPTTSSPSPVPSTPPAAPQPTGRASTPPSAVPPAGSGTPSMYPAPAPTLGVPTGGALPDTGADLTAMLLLGLTSATVGTGLVLAGRRRELP